MAPYISNSLIQPVYTASAPDTQPFEIKPNEKFVTIWMRFLAFFGHSKSKEFIASTKPINVTSVTTFDAKNGIQKHTEAKTVEAFQRVLKYEVGNGNQTKETKAKLPPSELKDKLESFISDYISIIYDNGEVDKDFMAKLEGVINCAPGSSLITLKTLYQALERCQEKVKRYIDHKNSLLGENAKPNLKNPIENLYKFHEEVKIQTTGEISWKFVHPQSRYSKICTAKYQTQTGTTLKCTIKAMIQTEKDVQLPTKRGGRSYADYLSGRSGYKPQR